MPIRIGAGGELAASKIFLGTTPITKVYVGSTQVWPPAAAGGPPVFFGAGALVLKSDDTITAPLPADTQADDIAIFACLSTTSRTFSTPSGWNVLGTPSTESVMSSAFFWRRLTGGDANPVTTLDSAFGASSGGKVYVIRGCTTSGTPFEDVTLNEAAAAATGGDMQVLTFDTSGPDRLAMVFWLIDDDHAESDWNSGYPPEWTAAGEDTWDDTGDGTIGAIWREVPSATTITAFQLADLTTTEGYRTLALAFIPAS